MPLQHRHTYAAGFRCGLRADEKDTDRRSRSSAGADKRALLSRPTSPRLEPVRSIERLSDAGSSRTPSRFACQARTVWECRPASSLSGLLPALPCTSRVRLPSASPACCDRPEAGPFHPHPVSWRSWRTFSSTQKQLRPRGVVIEADYVDDLVDQERSDDILSPSTRCGFSSKSAQIRPIVERLSPERFAIDARDQCVALSGLDSKVVTRTSSTWSRLTDAGRPDRGSSTRPSRRSATNRRRHFPTVGTLTPRSAATAWLEAPSEQASTILARDANA